MRRFESGKVATAENTVVGEEVPMPAPRYEVRECWRCSDGRVYEPSVPTGRWVPCPSCGGTGERSVYLYPNKGRRS